MILRPAIPDDVPAFLDIKTGLRFAPSDAESTRGGFLLGAEADAYLRAIHEASTWVLADDHGLQGFAIVQPDGPFRAGDIWARRDDVRWRIDDVNRFMAKRLCYYDQLAVRRGGHRLRRWGAALALAALWPALHSHDHLVTATVTAPVRNLAAVPYIRRLGGRIIGDLDETYPIIGDLISDIWLVDRAAFNARVAAPRGLAERWLVTTVEHALQGATRAVGEPAC